jgi:hypothetical protein
VSHSVRGVVLGECAAIAQAVQDLDEAAFAVESNCPPWTLKELIVHTWQTLLLPRAFRAPAVEGGAVRTAADWYRRSERETPEYRSRNVDQARAAAAAFASGADAVRALVAAGREFEARIGGEDLDRVIGTPNVPAISLEGYVVTRVVSASVHGLDVALTIGRDPFTTAGGVEITCRVLDELLGMTRSALGWTDQELFAWGTGRAAPPAERVPASVAGRLPLIA